RLRGQNSDEDEKFVRDLAADLQLKLYVKHFDTETIAQRRNQSIQLVARNLRYEWFETLCRKEACDFVLTAHHRNDDAETFFINLLRGTGLEGLTGIPEKNGKSIRPLLPFSRKEIQDYAHRHRIKWREDASNASDNYL